MQHREVRYENILEALQANIAYIRESSEPYVLFTCCDAIGNIDYAAMLEKHIETGARFTCLCTPNPINKDSDLQTTEFVVEPDGRIKDILIRDVANGQTPGTFTSTHTYIMGREDLLDILEESIDSKKTSLRRDVLMPALADSKVMAYVTDETLLFIESTSSYLKSNLDLLNSGIRRELFGQELRPIITRAGNSAPAYYSESSVSTNSIVAAGCVIEGTVRNSIIFRGVHIKKGAVVENCVINQDFDELNRRGRLRYRGHRAQLNHLQRRTHKERRRGRKLRHQSGLHCRRRRGTELRRPRQEREHQRQAPAFRLRHPPVLREERVGNLAARH